MYISKIAVYVFFHCTIIVIINPILDFKSVDLTMICVQIQLYQITSCQSFRLISLTNFFGVVLSYVQSKLSKPPSFIATCILSGLFLYNSTRAKTLSSTNIKIKLLGMLRLQRQKWYILTCIRFSGSWEIESVEKFVQVKLLLVY